VTGRLAWQTLPAAERATGLIRAAPGRLSAYVSQRPPPCLHLRQVTGFQAYGFSHYTVGAVAIISFGKLSLTAVLLPGHLPDGDVLATPTPKLTACLRMPQSTLAITFL